MTPKPIKERQAHLKTIGETLLNARELSTEQREFIGNALIGISEGAEPKEQLDLKAKKGASYPFYDEIHLATNRRLLRQ